MKGTDTLGSTVLCADCKGEMYWGQLTSHWCAEAEQRVNQEIAAAERRLEKLHAERDDLVANRRRAERLAAAKR